MAITGGALWSSIDCVRAYREDLHDMLLRHALGGMGDLLRASVTSGRALEVHAHAALETTHEKKRGGKGQSMPVSSAATQTDAALGTTSTSKSSQTDSAAMPETTSLGVLLKATVAFPSQSIATQTNAACAGLSVSEATQTIEDAAPRCMDTATQEHDLVANHSTFDAMQATDVAWSISSTIPDVTPAESNAAPCPLMRHKSEKNLGSEVPPASTVSVVPDESVAMTSAPAIIEQVLTVGSKYPRPAAGVERPFTRSGAQTAPWSLLPESALAKSPRIFAAELLPRHDSYKTALTSKVAVSSQCIPNVVDSPISVRH